MESLSAPHMVCSYLYLYVRRNAMKLNCRVSFCSWLTTCAPLSARMLYILFPFSIYSNLVSITTIAILRSCKKERGKRWWGGALLRLCLAIVFADGQHAISCFVRRGFPGIKGVWQHFFVVVLRTAYLLGRLFAHTSLYLYCLVGIIRRSLCANNNN